MLMPIESMNVYVKLCEMDLLRKNKTDQKVVVPVFDLNFFVLSRRER